MMSRPSGNGVLLFHPGCGPFVQQAARALHETGLLMAYVTSFCYLPNSPAGRALRLALRVTHPQPERQLARRQITEVPSECVISHPLPELARMAARKLPYGPIVGDLVWEQTELWFDRIVARRHVRPGCAVYGYEHAALETFRAQKDQGGLCIYEMPSCHHEMVAELMGSELERYPELRTPYTTHAVRHAPRRDARRDRELRLADRVVVNSSFTKRSLTRAGVPADRVAVVPLGAPPVAPPGDRAHHAPFVFLSAGKQSFQKGTHYLLEAWRRLSPGRHAQLWLIGAMELPSAFLAGLPDNVVVRPPVPRAELFEIYRQVNALVFPSLAEGFGMVITEAMAAGLPVITTSNTAGEDLITHGRDGFIVPIRDAERLAAAMQWCLDHPAELAEIGREAALTAGRWQWEDYRAALGETVLSFLAAEASSPTDDAVLVHR